MFEKYFIREDGRIKALSDGPWGAMGTVGGFVRSERNLSHNGDCWVQDDAIVFEHAIEPERGPRYNVIDSKVMLVRIRKGVGPSCNK